MPSYTLAEEFTIRTLFTRYIAARGYKTDEGRFQVTRLARDVIANGGRGDADQPEADMVLALKAHLFRLADQNAKFPGVSLPTALSLHAVLRFGEVRSSDDRELGLTESDVDAWFSVTHLQGFAEQVMEEQVQASAHSLLRWALKRIPHPIATGSMTWLWVRGRFQGLRFTNTRAKPMLERALELALAQNAPEELIGIMRHDVGGAHNALGDLQAAQDQVDQAHELYSRLITRGDGRPNVKVGLARAKVRSLSLATWRGEPGSALDTRFLEARACLKNVQIRKAADGTLEPVHDYYGWCEAVLTLAYCHLLEENLMEASRLAIEGYRLAKQIHRGFVKDPFWQLRDGWALGAEWCTLHALALNVDLWLLTHHGPAHDPGSAIFSSPEDVFIRLQKETSRRWWLRPIPPLAPLYQWKLDLTVGDKSLALVRAEHLQRMSLMEELQVVMYLPLALIATGDLFRDTGHGDGGTDAIFWYQKAQRLAADHGFRRHEQLAARRLAPLG